MLLRRFTTLHCHSHSAHVDSGRRSVGLNPRVQTTACLYIGWRWRHFNDFIYVWNSDYSQLFTITLTLTSTCVQCTFRWSTTRRERSISTRWKTDPACIEAIRRT